MFGKARAGRGASWRIEEGGAEKVVVFSGAIADGSRLDSLARKLAGARVVFELGEVSRINSFGVREWQRMMRALESKGTEVVLDRCPQVIVSQICLIVGFKGHAEVRSVQVPYYCAGCNAEVEEVCSVDGGDFELESPLARPCRECGGELHVDDLAGYYSRLPEFLTR